MLGNNTLVNESELRAILSRNPAITTDDNPSCRQVRNPEPERDPATTLEPVAERETQSVRRIGVRFTGFRVRLLDSDNYAGSVKDLLDGLQYSGLIPGDDPQRITLVTDQVRVKTRKEERTEIVITYPE
jgi:hypothetical protein